MPVNYRYDEKGKIFTNIVSKRPVEAVIQTLLHTIHGEIHIRMNERFKDELNSGDKFLAVTNAVIYSVRGEELFRTSFLTVNRDQIVWLFPKNETPDMTEDESDGEAIE